MEMYYFLNNMLVLLESLPVNYNSWNDAIQQNY
jgi:hypothetical protein